jgi:leucyl aminopeptidase
MSISFRAGLRPLALAAFTLLAGACAPALAAPTWITIGERAHALLVRDAPEARQLATRSVAVNMPAARGNGGSRGTAGALTRGSEQVYAMEVDDAALLTLGEAVHDELRRCGGFIQHASAAEALATLDSVQGMPGVTAAPSYAIDNQVAVKLLLPQMQASNILSTIQSLSDFQNRRHTSSHGLAASNWLAAQWKALAGTRPDVRVTQIAHTGNNFKQPSVMLEITGSGNEREVVVLGGHLDSVVSGNAETVRAPGADDDASGVASMTEVIRVLMANKIHPKRTLRFYAYAGEESGLLGSKQIVASVANELIKIVGVMQLDMTAYQGSATDLWIYTDYTNAAQNAFVANLAATYLPQLTVGYDICGYGCSDHASWHVAGYPASFPFEASFGTDNPRIHTVNDTIANFGGTANHALKFSQLALAFMVELGSDRVPFKPR